MIAPLIAIWRQPVLQMRSRSSMGLSGLLLAVFGLGLFTLSSEGPKRGILFAIATGVPMCMLFGMWWTYLLGNVATQCHPAAVQLVPHLRRNILRAVVLAWIAIVAVMTLLAGVPTGHAAQVAIVTGLALIEVGVMAGMLRGGAIVVALWAACSAHAGVTASLAAWIQTPVALCCGVLVLVLDGAAALRRLARMQGSPPGKPFLAGLLDGSQAQRQAAAPGRGADRQPLFLRVLGRSWFGWHAGSVGQVLLLCVAALLWCLWHGRNVHLELAYARIIVVSMMAATLCHALGMEARRFGQARTEQALVRLSPGAPDLAALNRVLATAQLRGFLRSWAYLGVLMLAALAFTGAHLNELVHVAVGWTLGLTPAAMLLRDHAVAGEAARWPGALVVVCLSVVCSIGVDSDGASAWWIATMAAALVGSGLLTWWRWNKMMAAPPAFPAGRYT